MDRYKNRDRKIAPTKSRNQLSHRHRVSRLCGLLDRVGVTGLRPSPLPHHRTCGPASGGWTHRKQTTFRCQTITDTAGDRIVGTSLLLYRCTGHYSSYGPTLPAIHAVFLARRGDSCRYYRVRSLQNDMRSPMQDFGECLQSFGPSLHPHYQASSLLWPLLTALPLSQKGSPRVRCMVFRDIPPSST